MTKKKTRKDRTETIRVRKPTGANHKTNTRRVRATAAAKPKVKAQAAKAAAKPQPQQNSAGSNRAEGIRLFKLAGRPTREQFIAIYGERGPKMTWDQRAAAGVSAERFQTALSSASAGTEVKSRSKEVL
jgi:hypothetical protein